MTEEYVDVLALREEVAELVSRNRYLERSLMDLKQTISDKEDEIYRLTQKIREGLRDGEE
jgi:cell division protein FtsB